jgi:hypothetical protein
VIYTRHQASTHPHEDEEAVRTACGLAWETWQAPPAYADGSLGTLPGPSEPPRDDDTVFDCPVCEALSRSST